MPKVVADRTQFNLWLDDADVVLLEALAETWGVKRTTVARQAVRSFCDSAFGRTAALETDIALGAVATLLAGHNIETYGHRGVQLLWRCISARKGHQAITALRKVLKELSTEYHARSVEIIEPGSPQERGHAEPKPGSQDFSDFSEQPVEHAEIEA